GFRYGMPLSAPTLLELGYLGSNSEGTHYQNVDLSLRAQAPFQDLFVYGLVGPDLLRVRGPLSSDYTYYAGGHVGGGLLAHAFDSLVLRMEMRFHFHPGTVLFFLFGYEYRFGGN